MRLASYQSLCLGKTFMYAVSESRGQLQKFLDIFFSFALYARIEGVPIVFFVQCSTEVLYDESLCPPPGTIIRLPTWSDSPQSKQSKPRVEGEQGQYVQDLRQK